MSNQGEPGRATGQDPTSTRADWIRAYATMLVMTILVLQGWRMIRIDT